MVRSRFDAQLEQLNVELIKMGALCEEAITASVSALMKYDRTVVHSEKSYHHWLLMLLCLRLVYWLAV